MNLASLSFGKYIALGVIILGVLFASGLVEPGMVWAWILAIVLGFAILLS